MLLAVEAGPNPLIPNVTEIIVGLIAFGALYYVLATKAFPLFEKAYRERTEVIEGGIARAERLQAEAQQALEEYRAALSQARHEAAQIRLKAESDGKAIVDEARGRAVEEAARIMAAERAQIEAERTQALVRLRQEVGGLALVLAERIVGETLADDERQRRVVDRFLAELEQEPAGDARTPASAGEQVG